MSVLGKTALEYANRGWHVFPLAPHAKTPITKNGLKDATTDAGLVEAWWEERPNANIGIACEPSGLLVVDLDGTDAVRAWASLAARRDGHPRTLIARTGKGYHLYFTGQGRSSASRVAAGIDTRGAGGYVAAPVSVHDSGAVYSWLGPMRDPVPAPAWLLELLDRGNRDDERLGERRELPDGALFTPYGASALLSMTSEMACTPEGERNATLNAVAYRCGRLSAAGQLAEYVARRELIAAATESGLAEEEAARTFRSGFEAGLLRPALLERRS